MSHGSHGSHRLLLLCSNQVGELNGGKAAEIWEIREIRVT